MDYKTYALPSVHHFNSSVNRRAPDVAIQHRLGVLSQRRFGFNLVNRVACCFTSLASAKPSQHAIACTKVRRLVFSNALVKQLRLCSLISAPSAICSHRLAAAIRSTFRPSGAAVARHE
jgi:hypothetical protein